MPELVAPTVRLFDAWTEAHREWGPGLHEDGFGIRATDDVETPEGFATWVTRLTEAPSGQVYRWIVEDGRVLGGIALRYLPDGSPPPLGHLGYGIRPSARRRGVATRALAAMLREARGRGLTEVLLMCDATNLASAKTIERQGGRLEEIRETDLGPARRYWITLERHAASASP